MSCRVPKPSNSRCPPEVVVARALYGPFMCSSLGCKLLEILDKPHVNDRTYYRSGLELRVALPRSCVPGSIRVTEEFVDHAGRIPARCAPSIRTLQGNLAECKPTPNFSYGLVEPPLSEIATRLRERPTSSLLNLCGLYNWHVLRVARAQARALWVGARTSLPLCLASTFAQSGGANEPIAERTKEYHHD